MDLNTEVTANKAGKVTGTNSATVIHHAKKGAMPYRKRLSQYLIKLKDVQTWAESQGLTFDLSKL